MPEGYIAVPFEDPSEKNPCLEIKQCIQMLKEIMSRETGCCYKTFYSGMFSMLLILGGALYTFIYTKKQKKLFEAAEQKWHDWLDLSARISAEKMDWITEHVAPLAAPINEQLLNCYKNASEIFNKMNYDLIPDSSPPRTCPLVDPTNLANSTYCGNLSSMYQDILGTEQNLYQQLDSIHDKVQEIANSMANFTAPQSPFDSEPQPSFNYNGVSAATMIAMVAIACCMGCLLSALIDYSDAGRAYDIEREKKLTADENKQLADLCQKYDIDPKLPLKQLVKKLKDTLRDTERKIASCEAFLSGYKSSHKSIQLFFAADSNLQLSQQILKAADLLPPGVDIATLKR